MKKILILEHGKPTPNDYGRKYRQQRCERRLD